MYLKIKTEHHTLREKAAKFLKSQIGRFITRDMPISFGLEPSNACNANCTFCAYQYQQRPKGIMDMEMFRKTLDQYCDMGGGDVNFTPTVGDPLVDRNLIEKIRYARSKKEIKLIWFYSNLIALDSFDVEALLKSGLTGLRISTCIKDKETYLKIYRVNKYEQMVNNIVTLCKTNDQLGKPIQVLLFLRIPKPYEEVYNSDDYKRVAKYFQAKEIIPLMDDYDSWGGLIDERDLPAGNRLYSNELDQTKAPCSELFRRINVLYDGTVNNCVCRDLNADLKIGNIHEQSLKAIWKGKALRKIRKEWFAGAVPSTCQGCERYLPVDDYFADQWKFILKVFLQRKFHFMRSHAKNGAVLNGDESGYND